MPESPIVQEAKQDAHRFIPFRPKGTRWKITQEEIDSIWDAFPFGTRVTNRAGRHGMVVDIHVNNTHAYPHPMVRYDDAPEVYQEAATTLMILDSSHCNSSLRRDA